MTMSEFRSNQRKKALFHLAIAALAAWELKECKNLAHKAAVGAMIGFHTVLFVEDLRATPENCTCLSVEGHDL